MTFISCQAHPAKLCARYIARYCVIQLTALFDQLITKFSQSSRSPYWPLLAPTGPYPPKPAPTRPYSSVENSHINFFFHQSYNLVHQSSWWHVKTKSAHKSGKMVFKEPKIKWANSKARDLLLKYLRKKAMDGENKKYDPDKFRNRLGKFFIFSCNGCQDLNLKRRIFHFFVQRNPSNYLYWPLLAPIATKDLYLARVIIVWIVDSTD